MPGRNNTKLVYSPREEYSAAAWDHIQALKLELKRWELELRKLNKDWRNLLHMSVLSSMMMIDAARLVSRVKNQRYLARQEVERLRGVYFMMVGMPAAKKRMAEAMKDMIVDKLAQEPFAPKLLLPEEGK